MQGRDSDPECRAHAIQAQYAPASIFKCSIQAQNAPSELFNGSLGKKASSCKNNSSFSERMTKQIFARTEARGKARAGSLFRAFPSKTPCLRLCRFVGESRQKPEVNDIITRDRDDQPSLIECLFQTNGNLKVTAPSLLRALLAPVTEFHGLRIRPQTTAATHACRR
jgi:hypothetical protein